MAGDNLGFGEQFGTKVTRADGSPHIETKTRHYVMAWTLILSLFAVIGYFGWGKSLMEKPTGMQEAPVLLLLTEMAALMKKTTALYRKVMKF